MPECRHSSKVGNVGLLDLSGLFLRYHRIGGICKEWEGELAMKKTITITVPDEFVAEV